MRARMLVHAGAAEREDQEPVNEAPCTPIHVRKKKAHLTPLLAHFEPPPNLGPPSLPPFPPPLPAAKMAGPVVPLVGSVCLDPRLP